MAIPARCNKRACQARRNLPKRPEAYVKWPTCHVLGCSGRMYVDEYRLRRGPKDNAPVCRDGTCGYNCTRIQEGLSVLPYHRVSTLGCSGHEDYVLERSSAASPHCPNVGDESAPF